MGIMKKAAAFLLASFVALSSALPAYSVGFKRSEDGTQFLFDEKGNIVSSGGINEYKGEKMNSRDETLQLESKLKKEGYVLVSSDHKNISDEDFEVLKAQDYWFTWRYLDESDEFRWSQDKVYVYKKSFDDMLKEVEENGCTEEYTDFEIECSTVVLSYDFWHTWDNQGTLSDEFNDNIPEWQSKGYLLIDSPINVEIVLLNIDKKTYYRFYISADTPFLVAMPCSTYFVENINGFEIEDFETTLPSSNTIVINKDRNGTRENAYEVDISKTVTEYGIPSKDIGGEKDYSLDQNQNIPKEKTTVQEKPSEKKKSGIFYFIGAALMISAGVIFAVALYAKKRKNEETDNE